MVAVSPTTVKPTHHISLTDGTTTLGLTLVDGNGRMLNTLARSGYPRTALRMGTGAVGYGDFEPPFTPLVQSDWTGGRGLEDFDSDSTRYFDSWGVDTTHGDIILGPKETYTTGHDTQYPIATVATTSSVTMDTTLLTIREAASPYTPATNIAVSRISISAHTGYTVNPVEQHRARVIIYTDSGGAPDTVFAASGYLDFPYVDVNYRTFYFNITASLVSGTTYWIALEVTTPGIITVRKEVSIPAGHATLSRLNGAGAWTDLNYGNLAFVLHTAGPGEVFYFRYRSQLYAIMRNDNGTAPKIFMNGHRGVAVANTGALNLLKTSLNLSGVNLTGKVAKLIRGAGSREDQPWRVITSNTTTGTNDTITVNPPWNTAHDNTTEYVILGCDTWQDVATMPGGATYTALEDVTDVCVSDDVVHIAQGYAITGANIVDMCMDNNSGTFRTRFREQPYAAKFLLRVVTDTNKKQIWRATMSASGSFNDVSRTAAISYGPDFAAFSTAISCGNEDEPITGLVTYGDPSIPYVLKEGSFGSIKSDVYAELPVSEMASVQNDANGRAKLRHGVYLYFSLLDGMERYYNQQLDDIGPNRDEGFPAGRQGPIRKMIGYPGRIYYCVDAGDNGESCVMCYNMNGHHEIYRAPFGRRIKNIFIQVLPGDSVDRLWISEDGELVYLPVALNPRKTTGYLYKDKGTLTSAWMYGNLKDVTKYFHSMTLFTENLGPDLMPFGKRYIQCVYQTDSDPDWHAMVVDYDVSPVEENVFASTNTVTGKRFRYRISIFNTEPDKTARIKAVVINAVTRMPTKYVWTVNFLISDDVKDLNGRLYMPDGKTLLDKLEEWADSSQRAAPILVRSLHNEFDNVYMFLEPPTVRIIESKQEGTAGQRMKAIGQMTMIKV